MIAIDGKERARHETEDSNKEQIIMMEGGDDDSEQVKEGMEIKIQMDKASDLFGRIIMYRFELLQ